MVQSLNTDLGSAYDTARPGQWRRAERPIPQPVPEWMLRACIAHLIEACGGRAPPNAAQVDCIAAMLFPPKRPKAPQDD